MENINPKEALKFLEFVNNLKHMPRRGWIFSKVKDHEQIAGHMYAMAMMTFMLGDSSKLDRLKCLQLAVVHDLAEAIVGDITPHDNVTEEDKHRQEDEAMKEITSHLGRSRNREYGL
ncbi:5'-deoxynucleotidase HDDC2 isoform X2 [Cylas formicarius]|uniref:5'-deoxynucleotidase HDDC2 isoform X2 n=1 Tax=Cylas formicarius TaxID=197179 RepID=UPI002958900E|nr:5'-deoxynucleotidase HDDC2 isoform X2 [Cylas formicarius]